MTLSADYLRDAEYRARRFSGAYTGTSGTLAADVLRLIFERNTMADTIAELESRNAALRAAVEQRLGESEEVVDPTDIDDPGESAIPVDWILQGERELKEAEPEPEVRPLGAGVMADSVRPGSREFLAVLDELRTLHLRKTLDYGIDEDALSNIRSSADVVNMPAWAGCILRISDKMHRLKAFFRRGKVEFDGIEDTLKDIACYAAIALVLHREEDRPAP